ncbi:MAG: hypothetical protein GXP31_07645 [Kiritimatiellaeota bacterium]|nr:hypothetical protein [Kiritimatiellota bacterium]
MSSRCDKLREQALSSGLNSRAGLAWRVHCRSCEDCRTELFILETLERQALAERNHLGRREVAMLMSRVRAVHEAKPAVPAVLTWGLRTACVAAAVFVIGLLPRPGSQDFPGMDGALARAGRGSVPATAGLAVAAPAAGPVVDVARNRAGESSLPGGPSVQPAQSCRRRIRDLRRRIDARRDNLLKLLEHELGESCDQDVWDAPRPSMDLALA